MMRIDQGKITSKSLKRLIKLACKLAKLVTKISNKVHEFKTYNKAIDDLIHKNRWRKAINKKFWNLNSYQN